VIADIIDLAVAIHASDRLSFQNLRQQQVEISVGSSSTSSRDFK
jgi:hypothetical protein